MKKCCLVNFHGAWGGAEKVAIEVIKVLKKNYEPTLVTAFPGEFTNRLVTDDRINVHIITKGSAQYGSIISKIFLILVFGLKLRNYVKKENFDLLYLNNQVAIITSIFLLGLKCKIIAHDHTYQRRILKKLIYNLIVFVSIDRLIFVSRDLARHNIIVRMKKTRVIHNGFDFYVDNKKENLVHRTVVMPAMFRAWKGHIVLIEALAILADAGINFRCEILGAANSEAEKRYFKTCIDLVGKYHLSDRIKFIGFVDDVMPYLNRAGYVLVQPSNLPDPLPTTLIEACFLGIPMIGSKVGGIPEIIIEGENGFTFECNNSLDLAKQLKSLLLQPDALRNEMENHAKRVFSENFTAQKFQENIEKIIITC